MTPEEMAAEMIYRSYVYNRARFPEIKPERYVTLYENAAELERRYQESIRAYADNLIRSDMNQRHVGRPDHDMSSSGMPWKPGT